MVETENNVGAEIQLVVFQMGKEEYGVDIQQVREIIKLSDITRVPNAPEFIEGVINLRGQITPIMDLKKRLGLQASEMSDATRVIVSELENSTVGMIVDSVTEVHRLPEKNVDTAPSISMDIGAEFISGVGKLEDRLLILLDLSKILSKEEEKQMENYKGV